MLRKNSHLLHNVNLLILSISVGPSACVVEYVYKNNKGPRMTFGGFEYAKNFAYFQKIYWRCALHRTHKCHATAMTIGNDANNVRITNQHNHEPLI